MPRASVLTVVALYVLAGGLLAQSNSCDLAAPFGTVDAADVQAAINMVVGVTPCPTGSGGCSVTFLQRVVNAALGGTCATTPGRIQHAVELSWNASTANVSGYNIYRASSSTGPFSKVNQSLITATTFSDGTVSGGVTYYYVARSVDAKGAESSDSNQVQAVVSAP